MTDRHLDASTMQKLHDGVCKPGNRTKPYHQFKPAKLDDILTKDSQGPNGVTKNTCQFE